MDARLAVSDASMLPATALLHQPHSVTFAAFTSSTSLPSTPEPYWQVEMAYQQFVIGVVIFTLYINPCFYGIFFGGLQSNAGSRDSGGAMSSYCGLVISGCAVSKFDNGVTRLPTPTESGP
ncbi:hypothetical protein SCLCIDRAFT_1106113 [Scleroderma citrinum Foug A]|uniref:Uncharacterized protein n=1 Tax=Scleroderma citrinum Foug A TaxID=1036808 RepID=A0A0C3A1G4_9AGAM|nr:hypothetical protein SCLCIDRAFT_1106113 [Scleroderma citrinum Foug A]